MIMKYRHTEKRTECDFQTKYRPLAEARLRFYIFFLQNLQALLVVYYRFLTEDVFRTFTLLWLLT